LLSRGTRDTQVAYGANQRSFMSLESPTAADEVVSTAYQSGVSASCLATMCWRKAAADTGVAGVNGEAIIGAALHDDDDDVVRSRRQICWMTTHSASTTRHTTTLTATAAAEMLLSSDSSTATSSSSSSSSLSSQFRLAIFSPTLWVIKMAPFLFWQQLGEMLTKLYNTLRNCSWTVCNIFIYIYRLLTTSI